MKMGDALRAALLMTVTANATAAMAADAVDVYPLRPQNVIVVPDCAQNRPPVGLACIPRLASPYADPSAARQVVDLDRRRVPRPYVQIFSWGP